MGLKIMHRTFLLAIRDESIHKQKLLSILLALCVYILAQAAKVSRLFIQHTGELERST